MSGGSCRSDDVVLQVVEHHLGANSRDLASLRQRVEDEVPECLSGFHRHQDQQVLGAGRDEYLQCFRQRDHEIPEALHDLSRLRAKPDGDHTLHRSAHLRTTDHFATGNGTANRAAVAAVPREHLDLAGIAICADRKAVDKITAGLRLHP